MAVFPVDIRIDTGDVNKLAPLNRNLDQTDRSATAAAGATRALTAAIAGLGAGAAIKQALNVNLQFNKSISDLSAITGATGRDLQSLTQASKEFGATTTLSASQAAEAFKLIASAKPDLLSNVVALKAVTAEAIALAEAAGVTLPTATDILGNSLNQFNIAADESSRIINVLAAGAKFGSSSIEDTSLALKNAGVSAANAKVSFEETNAAIQALATSGLRGAEAGTALRNVLTILDTAADKSLRPSVVGLAGALDALAAKQLDNVEFVKLFGRENQNAARILLNQRENLVGLTAALTGTNTAYEQAATRTDNLAGDLLALQSAFEGVQIEASALADGGLRDVTQALTVGLQGLNENPERIADAIETLGVVATATAAVFAGRFIDGVAASTKAAITKTTATLAEIKAQKVAAAQTLRRAAAEKQAAFAVLSTAKLEFEAARNTNAHAVALQSLQVAQTRATLAAGAYNTALAATRNVATTASVAVGVLGRAMTFLGGPAGVILLALTALTAFSSGANEAERATAALNVELDKLSRNQAKQALNEVNDEIARLQREITDRATTIAELQESLNLGSAVTGADDTATARRLDAERAAFDSTTQSLAAYQSRQQELRDELDGVNDALERLNTTTTTTGAVTTTAATAALELSESYTKLSADLATSIALTQQSDRQASITAAVAKLAADATDEEREAAALLAATLFDLNKAREESERAQQSRDAIDKQVISLSQQLAALKLTGEAQAVYNATARLGAEATDVQRAQVEALTAAIYQQQQALQAQQALKQFDQSVETPAQTAEREAAEIREANLRTLEAGLQDKQQYADRELAIDAKLASDKLKLTQASQSAVRVATAQGLDALAGIVEAAGGKQSKAYRAIYAASRAFALADSIAKVTQASAQALADPTAVTLGQKFANYAAVATAGASLISALKPQQFADGGYVSGPGTGRSDSIPAWLSNGEYVMPASRTSQYSSELESMRRGTYSGGTTSTGARVTIINNVSDTVAATVTESPDGELIATIDRRIADQVPGAMANELSDPYSPATRALNSAYRLERQ